jgi:2-dehydropantoate 2-reductase
MYGNWDKHMNITIVGAGAIGSLFGAFLSRNNNVLLIGRKDHISIIKKSGITIEGKTNLNIKIKAETSIDIVRDIPDLLILTTKSYDTESAILQAKKIIDDNTTILSIQNGLDNIEKIKKYHSCKKIIAGVTTHGAFFYKPGIIRHTGIGSTVLGELDGHKTGRIVNFINLFTKAGIKTTFSKNILEEIWIKAIINSSINPLTTFFHCKNGYLLENPILEKLVELICKESTFIANAEGVKLSNKDMINKTKNIIRNTAENYSSMLQSFKKGKKTEIDSINCKLVETGIKYDISPSINEILTYSIRLLGNK